MARTKSFLFGGATMAAQEALDLGLAPRVARSFETRLADMFAFEGFG